MGLLKETFSLPPFWGHPSSPSPCRAQSCDSALPLSPTPARPHLSHPSALGDTFHIFKKKKKKTVLGSPTPKSHPEQAQGVTGKVKNNSHTSPCSQRCTLRIPETLNHLCLLGFVPHSSISTLSQFDPLAHLDLLPALLQLLGAQGGLSRWNFAFALPQPLPHGANQIPKLIQLLLAG